MPVPPPALKRRYSQVYVVREELRRREKIDLLVFAEVAVLRKLVAKVHEDGFAGDSWPVIERVPMVLKNGELRPKERPDENIFEWHVRASVRATVR